MTSVLLTPGLALQLHFPSPASPSWKPLTPPGHQLPTLPPPHSGFFLLEPLARCPLCWDILLATLLDILGTPGSLVLLRLVRGTWESPGSVWRGFLNGSLSAFEISPHATLFSWKVTAGPQTDPGISEHDVEVTSQLAPPPTTLWTGVLPLLTSLGG